MKANYSLKNVTKAILLTIPLLVNSVVLNAQCFTATYGQYPSTTFTPTCNATCTFQNITTVGYAGEYSVIAVTTGNIYTFKSSIATDYITVDNNGAAPLVGVVGVSGTAGISWTSTITGTVRFYTHSNSSCGASSTSRTRSVCRTNCGAVIAPANDLVCNASAITCGQTLAGTTVNATNSGTGENLTCSVSQSQPGVWYQVSGNGQIMTASLCATAWDSKISVFSGTCSSLTCVGGNDDAGAACTGTSASFAWNSVSGTNYFILVHGYSSNSAFSIALNCSNGIANDLVCNATAITCGQSLSGTTVNATSSGTGESLTCTVAQTRPGVWYKITGDGSSYTASLCSTTWDSEISVFSGTCSALSCVGGNDDNGPACPTSTSASYSWTSVAGTTYYILVHGYSTDAAFTLDLNCITPDPSAITASSNSVCSGNSVNLTALGVVGTAFWFTTSCSGTQVGTGNSISVTPTSTTTYYTSNNANGLYSAGCASITITVLPTPVAPVAQNQNICYGASAVITSDVALTEWFDNSAATNCLAISNSYTSVALTANTVFYVRQTVNGCSSPLGQSVINVNPFPSSITQVNSSATGCNIYSPNNWVYLVSPSNEMIAGVFDATGGNSLNATSADVTINPSVPNLGGIPYLQRVISITPSSNGAADVELYFTDAEFQALQTADPSLQSINDLVVTKFTGPGLVGAQTLLMPTQIAAGVPFAGVNKIRVSVSGFSTFVIHKNLNSGPLAIHLVKFEAERKQDEVLLNWITASEENNDLFTIERSADGINFEAILYKDGAGNSNSILNYSSIDPSPLNGYSYYRLKQTDYDGTSTYSPVRYVYYDGSDAGNFTPYPNPATLGSTIKLGKKANYHLFDELGKLIKTIKDAETIETSDLAPGMYVISNDAKQYSKIIIQ